MLSAIDSEQRIVVVGVVARIEQLDNDEQYDERSALRPSNRIRRFRRWRARVETSKRTTTTTKKRARGSGETRGVRFQRRARAACLVGIVVARGRAASGGSAKSSISPILFVSLSVSVSLVSTLVRVPASRRVMRFDAPIGARCSSPAVSSLICVLAPSHLRLW